MDIFIKKVEIYWNCEASVFSGVKRESFSFKDIKVLHNGGVINRTIKSRFFRSLQNFTIKIKDSNLSIKVNRDKFLKDNIYYPLASL